MHHTALDDRTERTTAGGAAYVALTDALDAEDLSINRYRLDPGDRTAGLHAHLDQEEVFYVLDGTVTFETLDGELAVTADETVRFEPGEFQSAKNADEEPATVLALGAPRESAAIRIPLSCSNCGHDAVVPTVDGDDESLVLACPECDHETDGACPECGSENVRAILAESGDPVAGCRDCGHEAAAL